MTEIQPSAVHRSVTAFNAQDKAAYLACYDEAVQVIDLLKDEVLLGGHQALEQSPWLWPSSGHQREVREQLRADGVLALRERLAKGDQTPVVRIMIYQLKDDLIRRIWLLPEEGPAPLHEPAQVVTRHEGALNAKDLAAFVECFSAEVNFLHVQEGKFVVTTDGREMLGQRFGRMFTQNPELVCKAIARVVSGDYVVDLEECETPGYGKGQGVCVYHVPGAYIEKVWFMPQEETAEA